MNLQKWMADTNNVYVGRHGRIFIDKEVFHYPQSIFANPFKVTDDKPVKQAVEEYTTYIKNNPEIMAQLHTLRGKNLGCFCDVKSQELGECHASVLAELVNRS